MEPQVCLLTRAQAEEHWDKIEWRIEATPETERFYAKDELKTLIFAEKMQVWTAGKDLVLFTQIISPGSKKVLQIVFAHGKGISQHWDELKEKFHVFGWMFGCTSMEVLGREGWSRRFRKEEGFKIEYVAYSVPITAPQMH